MPDPSKDSRSPVTEVGVFGLLLGLLLGFGAYRAFNDLASAPKLWGLARSTAIGGPLAALALAEIVSGSLLLATRNRGAIVACCVATGLASAFYFVFEVSTIGLFGGKVSR